MEKITIPEDHPLKLSDQEILLAQATLTKIEIVSNELGGMNEEAITNIVMASELSELGKVRLMFRAANMIAERL